MSYLPRSLGKFITAANCQFPVLMLTGPRQVGRTTLLKFLCDVAGEPPAAMSPWTTQCC